MYQVDVSWLHPFNLALAYYMTISRILNHLYKSVYGGIFVVVLVKRPQFDNVSYSFRDIFADQVNQKCVCHIHACPKAAQSDRW